jgi:hypothetical protein
MFLIIMTAFLADAAELKLTIRMDLAIIIIGNRG